jgi:hypothetical protein
METNHMSIICDAKNGFDYLKNDMTFKFVGLFLKFIFSCNLFNHTQSLSFTTPHAFN